MRRTSRCPRRFISAIFLPMLIADALVVNIWVWDKDDPRLEMTNERKDLVPHPWCSIEGLLHIRPVVWRWRQACRDHNENESRWRRALEPSRRTRAMIEKKKPS